MSEYVIKINNVSKSFKGFQALKHVDLSMKPGRIYGLIGKNGAGKTTLMRMISGLGFPSEGNIELFGSKGQKEFTQQLKRIGCLIEYPGMNGSMTARENLRLHRIIRGIPDKTLDDELLEVVGLKDTRNRKVKNFSLGMKQRLGIAVALIGNPELLILDEPVNGLDPVGVVEIRNLIKRICEERHITILISSHNLPELFQTATDYIIIDQGEIKQALTLDELEEHCRHYMAIACDQPQQLAQILETKLNITDYRVMENQVIRIYDFPEDLRELSKTIYENGVIPTQLSKQGETLEHYFLSVIGGAYND